MNWQRNLGPALTATGHALMVSGVAPNLGHVHHQAFAWIAGAGIVLSALGTGASILFKTDKP